MIVAARILAVIAASFFVLSAALALLGPRGQTLAQLLFSLDRGYPSGLERGVRGVLSPWFWDHLMFPLMARPAWLLPMEVGIVAAGLALTVGFRRAEQTQRGRKRS